MEKILRLSIELGKPIIIIYEGKQGITRRKVKVARVEDTRIFAYCFLREANRYFKLDKILSAQICE